MVFEDRVAKYPGRWTMVKTDGTSEVVTLIRNDEPVVEGTPMNADTLNTLSDVAGADVARTQAEAAAANAKASQESAASSATAASSSASAAKSSETNAKASQTASATSEANAKSSANAAATSEANAKKYSESVQALSLGLCIVDGKLCMAYTPAPASAASEEEGGADD